MKILFGINKDLTSAFKIVGYNKDIRKRCTGLEKDNLLIGNYFISLYEKRSKFTTGKIKKSKNCILIGVNEFNYIYFDIYFATSEKIKQAEIDESMLLALQNKKKKYLYFEMNIIK